MKAVVLVAGKGVRLWPLSETRPKPLLPIANKPILEHTIGALVDSGIHQIVLVINYKGEKVQEKFGDGASIKCEIEYVKQKRPRGTADAVAAAGDKLESEDRFVLVYGDDYYENDGVKNFLSKAQATEGVSIATAKVEDASQFGIVESKNGRVTGIREKTLRKGPGIVNAGLYLMTNQLLSSVKKTGRSKRGEFELTDSLRLLIEKGEVVRSHSLDLGQWLGISYPWDLLGANQLAVVGEKTRLVRGNVEDGARIEGPVVIEEGSVIKAGSRLEGPVHVGRDCEIGPSAYLRPHTSLGNDVKVGAACEVKNSVVMAKTKIPHLSYVGDSIIGESCSLGAGTITANLRFDEAVVKSRVRGTLVPTARKKLGAILGDEVRTGINVSIFPGVKIGPKSWLGPGAIVEKDVMSRARYKA
ncbi:MAG TPA: bifunctional sugar-1-phosphate nucleotidylyltransferase/acetyltransferase [Candidatus Dormibacteraeota bacterium]|nr:bifunctional sugar-1-phosphate nucleotidylyltransferase/acetyltransferase [Candidatus Dormibacteraeota bacterium]